MKLHPAGRRGWRAGVTATLLVAFALALPAAASAATTSDNSSFAVTAGSLTFGTPAPNVPDTLSAVTLNGSGSQTSTGEMNNFQVVDATGLGSGWNLTVNGDASTGKSAVFKQYCPNASCGADSGPGYVSGGASLPASSLTLSSSGASLSGPTGSTAPANQCNTTPCALDTSAPTKIVSAATSGGMGSPSRCSRARALHSAISTPALTPVAARAPGSCGSPTTAGDRSRSSSRRSRH